MSKPTKKKKKDDAETRRFGRLSHQGLVQRLLDVSIAWGCAAELYGKNSDEAKEVVDEWKDLAEQAYLRAQPQAVDDDGAPIPRAFVDETPLFEFRRMKAQRAREKAGAGAGA